MTRQDIVDNLLAEARFKIKFDRQAASLAALQEMILRERAFNSLGPLLACDHDIWLELETALVAVQRARDALRRAAP